MEEKQSTIKKEKRGRDGRFIRQSGILPKGEIAKKKVIVIGAGGIGSWVTLLLSKMGVRNITVFDFDEVEEHNVASQLFDEDMVGLSKVIALQKFIKKNTGDVIKVLPYKFDRESLELNNVELDSETIIVLAVDSLVERKKIALALRYKFLTGVIDGRMGGEQVEVYTYSSAFDYWADVIEVKEAMPDPCTSRAIVYNTNLCGSIICSQVKKLILGQEFKKNIIFDFGGTSLLTNK